MRLDGSGDYVLAQADSEANAEVVGVVIDVADANTFTLQDHGYLDVGLAGLTVGAVYYLSDTVAGDITATEPAGTGEVSKPVLIAESATTGWITTLRGFVISAGGGGGGAEPYWPFFLAVPDFANGADMDWRGAADLGPYTAVAGSEATVVLDETTNAIARYERTPSGLLIQTGEGDVVQFRADYTLPDEQSMVIALSGAPNITAGDNHSLAMRLNDNDAGSTSGNYIAAMIEQDTSEYRVQGNSSIDSAGIELNPELPTPLVVLLRISRSGLTYRSWVSLNLGMTWNAIDSDTFGAALTNVWIAVTGSNSQGFIPTARIVFICEGHGDDGYDPW